MLEIRNLNEFVHAADAGVQVRITALRGSISNFKKRGVAEKIFKFSKISTYKTPIAEKKVVSAEHLH